MFRRQILSVQPRRRKKCTVKMTHKCLLIKIIKLKNLINRFSFFLPKRGVAVVGTEPFESDCGFLLLWQFFSIFPSIFTVSCSEGIMTLGNFAYEWA